MHEQCQLKATTWFRVSNLLSFTQKQESELNQYPSHGDNSSLESLVFGEMSLQYSKHSSGW